ncbi:AAA family ATPase [Mycoplasmatota bacterium WC44]
MFEKFSNQAKNIIYESRKNYFSTNHTIGSECLLMAMFGTEDSICRFLLTEYEVKNDDLRSEIESLYIVRKEKQDFYIYTPAYKEILYMALKMISENSSELVNEEHVFLSILKHRKNLACSVLESLGLSIENLIEDVEEVFDFTKTEKENKYLINLTSEARANKLSPFIGREFYLNRLEKVLSRKTKANPLLIGNAGVGKTAIVEGLAMKFANSDDYKHLTINAMKMSDLVAGSRYRGDFEERIVKILEEVKGSNNILFIDEIHNIIGTGNSEGTLDAANILKPYLARSDFKVIGATTLDEYNKHITKDKALTRRFQSVFVEEPSKEETLNILRGIKQSYEEYHETLLDEKYLEYIISEAENKIVLKKFPDKAIDILDESFTEAKFNKNKKVSIDNIKNAIKNITGVFGSDISDIIKMELNYPEIKKYLINFLAGTNTSNIMNVLFEGNHKTLIDDLYKTLNITEEMLLKVDLKGFKEHSSISRLIGAPPGYVGFDRGGILSDHIKKYPISVVMFSNIEFAHFSIQAFIHDTLKSAYIADNFGNKIPLKNVMFICEDTRSEKELGFLKQESKDDVFDIKLVGNHESKNDLSKLKYLGYNVNLLSGGHDTTNLVFSLLSKYPKGNYSVDYSNEDKKYIITKVD